MLQRVMPDLMGLKNIKLCSMMRRIYCYFREKPSADDGDDDDDLEG